MGENSGIGWTDHTHNPWIGCDEVGPACDDCYARFEDFRRQWGVPKAQATANREAGIAPHWGPDAPRHRTAESLRRQPYVWNEKAKAAGRPAKVFSLSLGDVFDKRVPREWREDLWRTIAETPYLRWILVTKRIPNADAMLPEKVPRNAGIVATVVTQAEVDRDGPRLQAVKARRGVTWVGFSIEPQLEYMILLSRGLLRGVDWVISGGESKQGKDHVPRVYDLAWARSLRDQCGMARAAYFQKQMGSRPANSFGLESTICAFFKLKDRAGADPSEWPSDLQVQQFPPALLQ